jgi:arabinan endo-1,5-alpha-L-arabinosidase
MSRRTRRRGGRVVAPLLVALALALVPVGVVPAASASAVPASVARASVASVSGVPESRPTDPIAHDPTMAKEGDYYYVIITGDSATHTYLPIKRSKDLLHWEEVGTVFTTLPSWVIQQLGTTPADAWAPDLERVNGHWALYYAASQFGTQNSVIGLATASTLDPSAPGHGWTDQGMVLRSTPGVDDFNAIDPEYATDAQGGAWLAFGSFWGGIRMRRLDVSTGKPSTTDTAVRTLASRVAPDAEEGASIVRHDGHYYLFLSFDYCCRGVQSDYRTMVGRSDSITGPYVDRSGVPLTSGGGTEVLRGYNEFVGTGGGDVYTGSAPGRSGEGATYFVNHYYDATDAGTPRLNVRPVSWSGGWPVIGDPVNPSRSVGHGDAYVRLIERTTGRPVVDVGCGYEGADLALGVFSPADLCQQWQFGYRGNGTSSLLNRFSNKVAEVAACDNRDGGRVAQWGWIGFLPNNDCQRWTAVPTAGGWTTVQSVLTGSRVMDVSRCAGGADDTIDVRTRTAALCQEFRFEPAGPVLLVDQDPSSGPLAGPVAGSARRQWRFTSAGGAAYAVTDVATGRPLGSPSARWTLLPRNDGSWNLSLVGTSVTRIVRVLIP